MFTFTLLWQTALTSFTFTLLWQTALTSATIWTVWAADKAQLQVRGAVIVTLCVLYGLVLTLASQHGRLLLAGAARDLLTVSTAMMALCCGFSLCGWPEPTRTVATVALLLVSLLWWVTGTVRAIAWIDRRAL